MKRIELKVRKSTYKAEEQMPKFITHEDIRRWWSFNGQGHFNDEHYRKVLNARK